MVNQSTDYHGNGKSQKPHGIYPTQLLCAETEFRPELTKNTRPDAERKGCRNQCETAAVKKSPLSIHGRYEDGESGWYEVVSGRSGLRKIYTSSTLIASVSDGIVILGKLTQMVLPLQTGSERAYLDPQHALVLRRTD